MRHLVRVRVPPIPPEISNGDEDLNTQFVLVRHPDRQMLRWFCVPYDLSSEITVPGIVLYETERGYDFGFVDGAMLIDEDRASTFLTMISAENLSPIVHGHLNSIIAVWKFMLVSSLYLAPELEATRSKMKRAKLKARYDELKCKAEPQTPVLVTTDGEIIDGMSAYLAYTQTKRVSLPTFMISDSFRPELDSPELKAMQDAYMQYAKWRNCA